MATLRLEVVTPEEKVYSEDVEMVTLPGSEGELGVYPKHVPLLTTLKPSELRILKNGRETSMAVGEGFVEIRGDIARRDAVQAFVSWLRSEARRGESKPAVPHGPGPRGRK